MVDFSFDEILSAYRKELSSPGMAELPDGFYQDVGRLVSRLLMDMKAGDELKKELLQEEMNNIVFFVKEIHDARVTKSMEKLAWGEAPALDLEGEQQAFSNIREQLEKLEAELVFPALSGKVEVPLPAQRTRAALIIVSNLNEKIMGSDLRSYGPFSKGEIVNIPEPNAELMVRRGYARRIRIKA
ncbi:MAG: hypothetical protein AB1305_05185 [Candidatus Hadarchaeota archaeon]